MARITNTNNEKDSELKEDLEIIYRAIHRSESANYGWCYKILESKIEKYRLELEISKANRLLENVINMNHERESSIQLIYQMNQTEFRENERQVDQITSFVESLPEDLIPYLLKTDDNREDQNGNKLACYLDILQIMNPEVDYKSEKKLWHKPQEVLSHMECIEREGRLHDGRTKNNEELLWIKRQIESFKTLFPDQYVLMIEDENKLEEKYLQLKRTNDSLREMKKQINNLIMTLLPKSSDQLI